MALWPLFKLGIRLNITLTQIHLWDVFKSGVIFGDLNLNKTTQLILILIVITPLLLQLLITLLYNFHLLLLLLTAFNTSSRLLQLRQNRLFFHSLPRVTLFTSFLLPVLFFFLQFRQTKFLITPIETGLSFIQFINLRFHFFRILLRILQECVLGIL